MSKTEWLMSAPMSATNQKADTPLYHFLVRLMRGENLSMDEASEFFRALTAANANTAQIAGALVALTTKGETSEELAGMTRIIREQAVKIKTRQKNVVDMSGTGSGAVKTFNVSTGGCRSRIKCRQTRQPRRNKPDGKRGCSGKTRRKRCCRTGNYTSLSERCRNLFFVRAEISPVSEARRRCPP